MIHWTSLPVPVRRLGYRFAYTLLRVYWFLLRPQGSGVKCVLKDGEKVLLVRHTYGPRHWDLPGGALKSKEDPRAAATREMQEELGVSIEHWTALGKVPARIHHRRDSLHCFHAQIDGATLTVDRGEIDVVQLFAPDQLPADRSGYVKRILALVSAESER